MYLTEFESQTPKYSYKQKQGLQELSQLHKGADHAGLFSQERMEKISCKPENIGNRNCMIPHEWHEQNHGFRDRNRLFHHLASEAFREFYPVASPPPDELIHVTCTGYFSPSAAQLIVLNRGWEKSTQVTHAYHMGCMAALPAIRIASGYSQLGKGQVDIVHTEFCSLHLNPSLHSDEQLVAQSLFADGMIKYSLKSDPGQKPALKILTLYEELIPQTEDKMTWECEDWGLKMTLSKEIPILIKRAIQGFISQLEKRCGFSLSQAYFAVHPGGPKIIEIIGNTLKLSEIQLATSKRILYNHGNMSSATLPHIWKEMVDNPEIPSGSAIVGLAFGPGLCMCGAVLQKESVKR